VRIELGPVSGASARSWIGYAREVIATRRAHDDETLPADLRAGFEVYLDEWEAAARGGELRWEAEIAPEVVEYMVHGFYRVATRLAEEGERRGGRASPPEGDEFYHALVAALLEAMASEGAAAQEFAEHLREFWPGLDTPS
jgi:hypothetical protein